MTEINETKVSQAVLTKFNEIANNDGKKGISCREEYDKLGEYLNSGQVTGGNDRQYLKQEMDKYEIAETKSRASKEVIKIVDNIKTIANNKKEYDDSTEFAALYNIIDNVDGKYSADDIAYVKAIIKSLGLSEQSPLQQAQQDLEIAKQQLDVQQKQIEFLQKQLEETEQKLEEQLAMAKATATTESATTQDAGVNIQKENIERKLKSLKDLKKGLADAQNEITVAQKELANNPSANKLVNENGNTRTDEILGVAGTLINATRSFIESVNRPFQNSANINTVNSQAKPQDGGNSMFRLQ
jgi:hypothetical protein